MCVCLKTGDALCCLDKVLIIATFKDDVQGGIISVGVCVILDRKFSCHISKTLKFNPFLL